MVQPIQKDKWESYVNGCENGIFFNNDFITSPENKNTVHIKDISEYLEN
jgi:hypothetical protein